MGLAGVLLGFPLEDLDDRAVLSPHGISGTIGDEILGAEGRHVGLDDLQQFVRLAGLGTEAADDEASHISVSDGATYRSYVVIST